MIQKFPTLLEEKPRNTKHTVVSSAGLPSLSRSDDLQSLWSKPRLETGRNILNDNSQKKKKKKKKKKKTKKKKKPQSRQNVS